MDDHLPRVETQSKIKNDSEAHNHSNDSIVSYSPIIGPIHIQTEHKRQQYRVNPKHQIERSCNPLPLSNDAQCASTRLFFGGTFDPPHLGHTELPTEVLNRYTDNGRLIYVPAARSPFKETHPSPDNHRVEMLKRATVHHSRSEIWTQELVDAKLNPNQPSYWADTWAIAKNMNLTGTNRFLIGSDQALSMHRWRRFEEFWHDATVMLRDGASSPEALLEQLSTLGVWTNTQVESWEKQIVVVPTVEASSTEIRAALMNPQRRDQPVPGLNPAVHMYILEHDLYMTK
jgi:nicotinate-nucleotide adenylyltransferase